ncbi:molecular chaperone SurA [Aestuariicella hydrocarbonica]|uniref:Chaperone SurA n=1 Tax=Pseudomaricurvus hydrocarbonicus TaxID=1470433 RepID=A0A9E5MMG4_9GAMM|nr:peptidylprolyl isomerase [Aestuariicella hydrocarbonica]NHO66485.1 molecular chaperone SurA [Aestuariicella hydrocarbonica]
MINYNTFKTGLKSLTAGAALAFCSLSHSQTVPLDKVIAVVDNDVVMASELNQRMRMVVSQLRANQTQLPPEDILRSQITEQLITESLQLQMGQRAGVQVDEAQIDAAINRMKQANNIGDAEFERQLAADGISINSLREQIRRDMIIEQVQRGSVNRRIRITEQEVENFLKSKQGRFWASPDFNLGHILIAVSSSSDSETIKAAEEKANNLRAQILNGANFRELAVTESQGQNALKGGDLGWRKTSEMPELFAENIEGLEKGDVTPPLRSGAGFHILKIYDKRGAQEQVIEQSKVRHILIKPSAILTDEQARQKLADIRQQILDGADFAEMARTNSEDVGSMLSGGDLGWSLPGKFVPEFERTINSTPVGDISQPFRSQFGWHILQVEERRQQDMSETVRTNQAMNLLRSRRFEEERINWLQEIRDEAYVEIKNDPADSAP